MARLAEWAETNGDTIKADLERAVENAAGMELSMVAEWITSKPDQELFGLLIAVYVIAFERGYSEGRDDA